MNVKSYNELRRNTIIIAISNVGSKAISFLLAPLYSFFLSVEEYGSMDLIVTTAGLLLPFVCFDIFEATFRYAGDKRYDSQTILSSSLMVCTGTMAVIMIVYGFVHQVHPLPMVVLVCIISAILDSFYQVLSQFARGSGNMVAYAIGGIISSLGLLLLNLLLLVCLSLGLTGWIYSFLGAKILAILYLSFRIDLLNQFRFSKIKRDFIGEAIRFCLPLVPGASMWWIMNASDRYVISFALGISAAGIYAVAAKLPALLSVFENIFYQAWQTTAIKTANSPDRDKIYSEVFWNYFKFLSVGVMGILLILKPMIIYCFSKVYHSAWSTASILVIGVMVHALAANLGMMYIVFKGTGGAFKTTALGAVVNFVLNVIFVPVFGIVAAGVTTVVGYFVVYLYRWYDIKRFTKITLPWKKALIYTSAICVQLILYYIPGIISFLLKGMICVVFLYANKDLLLGMLKRTK